jgi:hypothetical protein
MEKKRYLAVLCVLCVTQLLFFTEKTHAALSSALADQVLTFGEWTPNAFDDDTVHEQVSWEFIQQAVASGQNDVGVLTLLLAIGRWGISNPPQGLCDPEGINWAGRPGISGKQLMDYNRGGLGIAHYDTSKLFKIYDDYGFPNNVPTSWRSLLFDQMRDKGLGNNGENPQARVALGNGTTITQEQAWANWKTWARDLLRRREVQIDLLNRWIDDYWQDALRNTGGDTTVALVNARIANSSPALASDVGGLSIEQQLQRYDHADRNNVMLRPVLAYRKATGMDATCEIIPAIAGITPAAGSGLPSGSTSFTFNENNVIIRSPQPRIRIPGLSFTDNAEARRGLISTESDGSIYLSIPFLGEYLAAVYRYTVAAGSIVAVIMIIVAGIQWVTSAGNSEGVSSAKQRIVHAITGLVLTVSSYIILYTIDPELVQFKNLRVQVIKPDPIEWARGNENVQGPDSVPIGDYPPTIRIPEDGNLGYSFNNVPYYAQGSAPWGTVQYGTGSCTTYANGGCGPTSIAMVLQFIGINANPMDVGRVAVQTGARICGTGTAMGQTFLNQLNQTFGIQSELIIGRDAHNVVIPHLRAGRPIIQGGEHSGYTASGNIKSYDGHFIVLTGIDIVNGEEVIRVNDPGRARPENGIVFKTMAQFLSGRARFIYIHR